MPCRMKIEDLPNLQDAANWWVVMEGDWGGQTYLITPVSTVSASPSELKDLLKYLDAVSWPCNEGEGTDVYLERSSCGTGLHLGHLWLHSEFHFDSRIKPWVFEWLNGKRPDVAKLESPGVLREEHKDQWDDWDECHVEDCPNRDTCGTRTLVDDMLDCKDETCAVFATCHSWFENAKKVEADMWKEEA